jgi:hypothetical protein
MPLGRDISEQDLLREIEQAMHDVVETSAHLGLLNDIHRATRDVVETSAHVERRLREARVSVDRLQHVEAPPIGDGTEPPA